MAETFKVETTVEISYDVISSLLCCAFEGGSNYWYCIEDEIEPAIVWSDGGKPIYSHLQYPLSEGGAVIVSVELHEGSEERTHYTLDLAAIRRGIQVMAKDEPAHFADALSDGRMDAVTGDVFLQCCLFGEVLFG